ncbi:hypothetical protein A0W34_13600 [Rhodococcus sp. BH4]|uniref:hypothetical protein n=1 Tax=Rhodococcus sp. BH4 TaxID=1807790 RepID=UPI0009C3118B|nr:hypothetical protein [Rhodococcus sp. BH4]ARE34224.1 hypothetical protein A0W34_13600 [Rhodococcus sp. BH4]
MASQREIPVPVTLENSVAGTTPPDLTDAMAAKIAQSMAASRSDGTMRAYATAQQHDWARDPRVSVFARPLAYHPDGTARQKGVDSATARAVHTPRTGGTVDAVILATTDRDFEPDIEEALTTTGARIESACWITQKALFVAAGGRTLFNLDLDEHDLRRGSILGRAA